MAMTLVSTVTVGAGGASSIEFTNIPQTGKDLLVLFNLRSARTTEGGGSSFIDYVDLTFNSSTSNYSGRFLYGSGSATASFTETIYSGEMPSAQATSNTFGNGSAYISNYTASANKSHSVDTVTENNGTFATQILAAKLWSDSSAITSLKLAARFQNLVQHSTASLYIIS